ncbi:hypothetical protein D3C74_333560 [compost metagenome]
MSVTLPRGIIATLCVTSPNISSMRLSVATNHSLRQSRTFHSSRTATASHTHQSMRAPSPTVGPEALTSHATTRNAAKVVATGSASLPQWARVASTTRSPGRM